MSKLFPEMYERPESRPVMFGIMYGLFSFVFIHSILTYMLKGAAMDYQLAAWTQMAYHLVNCLVAVFIFRTYLKESFFNVQVDTKSILMTSAICILMMVTVAAIIFAFRFFSSNELFNVLAFSVLPFAETDLYLFSSSLTFYSPVWATVCLVLVVPLASSCLYYAVAFAPACTRHRWLGYLVVAIAIAIPRIINIFAFWDPAEQIGLYLIQLPLHLIACWGYQKTDTIWTPVFAHAGANLIGCLFTLYMWGTA